MATAEATKKSLNEADAHLLLFGILEESYGQPVSVKSLHNFMVHSFFPNILPAEIRDRFERYQGRMGGRGALRYFDEGEGASFVFLVLDYLCQQKLLKEAGSRYSFTKAGRQKFAQLREGLDLHKLEELAVRLH